VIDAHPPCNRPKHVLEQITLECHIHGQKATLVGLSEPVHLKAVRLASSWCRWERFHGVRVHPLSLVGYHARSWIYPPLLDIGPRKVKAWAQIASEAREEPISMGLLTTGRVVMAH
jgi:hypothetical protein